MIKFEVYNSIIDSHFKEVSFQTEVVEEGKKYRNVNLIFASNASGKTTFSTIIENYFDKVELPENRFTKNKSSMKVLVNDENFNKVYRYDKMFSSKSTDLYKGELIISPKNADVIVKTKQNIDDMLKKLLDIYKHTSSYAILKNYTDSLKDSPISKLAAKRFMGGSEIDIYKILSTELTTSDLCKNFSIEDLLDLMTMDVSFLDFCNDINEETISLIKDTFPDIDKDDVTFYNELLKYLTNSTHKVLDNICLMCGKTKITPEILNERIDYINNQIKLFQTTLSNNQFFSKFNTFMENSFRSKLLTEFQTGLKGKQSEDLIKASVKIGNRISELSVLDVKRDGFKCIIKKILHDSSLTNQIESIKNQYLSLDKIQQDNSNVLDEKVKEKFKNNLIEMQFKYATIMSVQLKDETISITFNDMEISDLYNEVLSESEKSILSLSLFLAIIKDYDRSIVIVDDPIDSHDQKNKWFILGKINEYFSNNNALVIILTHDLDVSKSLNQIDSTMKYSNYILTPKGINKISGPSLYFSDINTFVYNIKTEAEKAHALDNEKYILPIGFLLRYLCKNQCKFLNEINTWAVDPLPANTITRKMTKNIGFDNISNFFVHYKSGVNSEELVKDLYCILKVDRRSNVRPPYICSSIDSDLLIEGVISDISSNKQYDKDLGKILTALLIRNLIEKKMTSKVSSSTDVTLGDCVRTYKARFGDIDPLYMFYISNKFMINAFAHLESGVDALLTYDNDHIIDQLKLLRLIV